MSTQRADKGFTLIELLVAITIFAVMAAIAAPNFQQYMQQRRLNGAARQVMSDLMAARMRAVNENSSVQVVFLNDRQYQIGGGATRDIQTDYPGVTFSGAANPTFSPNGTATPTGGVTVNNASSTTRSVSVSMAGRVRIE